MLIYANSLFQHTDVDGIKYVINFDYPQNSEDYIHRIGRTGRSNTKGTSFAFFTKNNAKQAKALVDVLREANQVCFPDTDQLWRLLIYFLYFRKSIPRLRILPATRVTTVAVDAPVMVVAAVAVASAAVASRRVAWAMDEALAIMAAVVAAASATGMVATEVVDTRASIKLMMQTTLVSVDLNSKWEAALDVKLT